MKPTPPFSVDIFFDDERDGMTVNGVMAISLSGRENFIQFALTTGHSLMLSTKGIREIATIDAQ